MLNRIGWIALFVAVVGFWTIANAATPSPTLTTPTCAQVVADRVTQPTLPATKYVAHIGPTTGDVTIMIPGQAAPLLMGKLTVIKAGTVFTRWSGEPEISNLIKNGLTDQNLASRILSDPQTDIEGGGLYDSTNPTDSMMYGPAGAMAISTEDLQVVQSGYINRPDRLDILLAMRNAGIHAILETLHPSWFNFIRNDGVQKWQAVDVPTALQAISQLNNPAQELLNLIFIDQRITIRARDLSIKLPHGQLPIADIARKLILAQPLSAADLQLVKQMFSNQQVTEIMTLAQSAPLKQTPLFKGFDAAFAKLYGKSITEMMSNGN